MRSSSVRLLTAFISLLLSGQIAFAVAYDSAASGARIDWDAKPHKGALLAGVSWKTFESRGEIFNLARE